MNRSSVDYVVASEMLSSALEDLRRLCRIRGASHKTTRRLARAFAAALVAGSLLAPMPLAATPATCGSHFVNTVGFPANGDYAAPEFADIDGDGDLDLYLGDEFDYLMWFFENKGTPKHPSFAPGIFDPFGIGLYSSVHKPALADIDGDGDLDAFVGDGGGDTYFVENIGSATSPRFAEKVSNPFGLGNLGDRSTPAFVDIDGDGDLDGCFGTGYGDIVLFENIGTEIAPNFLQQAINPFGVENVGSAAKTALVDIDADADFDLFVGADDGDIYFHENTGSLTSPFFALAVMNPFGLSNVGEDSAPAFPDIDGDGDFDAFIGEYDGQTFFFENVGLPNAPVFVPPANDPFQLSVPSAYGAAGFVDIDGDGDLDGFVTSGGMLFFENVGSVTNPAFGPPFSNPFGLAVTAAWGSEPSFADIDADGDSDLLIGGSPVLFFENTGSASVPVFAAPVTNPFGLISTPGGDSPALVDLGGDGDLDAFVGATPTTFFENVGTAQSPVFASPQPAMFGLGVQYSQYGFSPDFVDVDGDGDLDALVDSYSYIEDTHPEEGNRASRFRDVISVLENVGTETSPLFRASSRALGFGDTGYSRPLATADLDGDGDLDIVAGNLGGGLGSPNESSSALVFYRNEPGCAVECPAVPRSDCRTALQSSVKISRRANPAGDKFLWKWVKGYSAKQEFGNPAKGTALALCFYDDSALAMSAMVSPGDSCEDMSCWKETRQGFNFSDKPGSSEGLIKMRMKEGSGRAKLLLKGKGTNLSLPPMPLVQSSSVTIQMVSSLPGENACWESDFDAPAAKNDESRFKDKDR